MKPNLTPLIAAASVAASAATLLLIGCGQIGDETREVVEAPSLERAWDEAGDVVDEVGDALTPNKRFELENELDRNIDELDSAISDLRRDLNETGHTIDDALNRELDQIERVARDARVDLERFKESSASGLDKLGHDIDNAVNDAREDLDEIAEQLKPEGK